MINELEKLKLNTNNINSVLLTSKKRVQKINLERKKFILTKNEKIKKENKEKKLESQKSPFGKSIKKINKNSSGSKLFSDLGGNILKLVSFLILGVALNNIDAIKKAFEKTRSFIEKTFKSIDSFITKVGEGAESFVNLFFREKDVDAEIEKFEEEISGIEKAAKKLNEIAETIGISYDKEAQKQITERFGALDLTDVDLSNQETVTPFTKNFDMPTFGNKADLKKQGFSLEPLNLDNYSSTSVSNEVSGILDATLNFPGKISDIEYLKSLFNNKNEKKGEKKVNLTNSGLIEYFNTYFRDPNLKNNKKNKIYIQPVKVD
tara:strand:- start:454 stop:1413 length:960 start_codon:yes stop_codon:yes gene_type:complete